jgi:hypothetical protein
MNLNQRTKKVIFYKPLTAGGKFMTFLQVLATLLLLVGVYSTLYYPLADYRIFFRAAVLLITALVSLGMLFYSEYYRGLWKDLNNPEVFDPFIITAGYYIYGFALFLAFITFLYFKTSKKNNGRTGKIVYSIILIILLIGLLIAHWFVQQDLISNGI